MVKDKRYYEDLYIKKWEECKKIPLTYYISGDVSDVDRYYHFNKTATVEEWVGHAVHNHGKHAYTTIIKNGEMFSLYADHPEIIPILKEISETPL